MLYLNLVVSICFYVASEFDFSDSSWTFKFLKLINKMNNIHNIKLLQ